LGVDSEDIEQLKQLLAGRTIRAVCDRFRLLKAREICDLEEDGVVSASLSRELAGLKTILELYLRILKSLLQNGLIGVCAYLCIILLV
jgi:hypothetical protein